MEHPRCPKCGEPARYIIAICKVKKSLCGERDFIGKPINSGKPVEYECGGHHRYTAEGTIL